MNPSRAITNRFSIFITAFALILALAWTTTAFTAPNKRAEAERLTHSLVGLNTAYQKAAPNAKAQALQQLIDATVERQALLAELVEEDPGAVLRVAIPARVRSQMPAEVQGFIEQRLELEGELEVIYEDYADGSHRLRHTLQAQGKRIGLHFKSPPPGLLSGTPSRASGVLVDEAMAVESSEEDILTLALGAGANGGTNGGSPEPVPNTFGGQHTLVILVNFQNNPVEPYSPDFARDVIFGQTSDFFLENSFGQTWLSGDVTGWHTIPVDSTICDDIDVRVHGEQAASDAGFNLSNYDRLVYAFPQNACSYWGRGSFGGAPSRAWLNGDLELELSGHELGHNLGLNHSHSLACSDGTSVGSGGASLNANPWPNCSSVEYGDGLDIMGWAKTAHFNAYQKERLGWLNHGDSPPIITVETSGTYELSPYAASAIAPKALKILKAAPNQNGYATWYYLEYRQAVGFDSSLATGMMVAENVLNGLAVHVNYEGNGGNSGYLLDMLPETYDIYEEDPALEVGETFTDPDGGSQITTDWVDSSGAIVTVQLAPPACMTTNPTIEVSPSQSQWVEAGTRVTFTATLSNGDSAACTAATFGLGVSLPSGWAADLATSSLTLEPGASITTTMAVTSSASASDGFYNVSINAANAADPAYSAATTVTYVVSNPAANQVPVAMDDSAETQQGTAVVVDVLANDSDPDGDPLSLLAATQGGDGVVTIKPDATVIYTPNGGFAGSDSFAYTVSDGNGGGATATVIVTVIAAPSNQTPVAVDDVVIIQEKTAVTIDVSVNDSDPDGDTLRVTSITQGAKGTVTINADNTLTYTPEKRFKDGDSFTYSVTDGAASATARVTISLQGGSGGGKGRKPKG